VIIGTELAKSLHVLVGDEVSLLSPMGELGPTGVMPRTRRFRVAAIFYSGMYEYDATHAYVLMIEDAQNFFSLKDATSGWTRSPTSTSACRPERVKEFAGDVGAASRRSRGMPPRRALQGRRAARARLEEMNKNLFSALKLEKIATFIILSIAIAVASFCIVCTLLLMVTEKGKEIAILKALGATTARSMRIFMLEGVIIGGIGTVFGVGHRARRVHRARVVRRPARSGRLLHRPAAGERDGVRLRARRARGACHLHDRHDLSRRRQRPSSPRRRPALGVKDGPCPLRSSSFRTCTRSSCTWGGAPRAAGHRPHIDQGEVVAIVGRFGRRQEHAAPLHRHARHPTKGRIRLGGEDHGPLVVERLAAHPQRPSGSSSSSTTCSPSSTRSRT
jgi:hypothetical protein